MKNFFSGIWIKVKERKVYTRIISIVLLLIAFLGLWGPLLKVKMSAGISSPFGQDIVSYENVDVASISLGDFADFSNVGDIKIFGNKFNTYNIGGINVYNFIKNPPKASGYITKVINVLNVDTLESFSDPALKEKITNIFPKYGENIFNITSSISKTVLNWRDALVSINNIVKDSSSTLNKASDTLNTVENVKTGVNVVVFIFFIIALVPIILLFIPRVSPFVPRVFAYICGAVVSLLIIVVLIMDPVVNNIVKGMISELNDYINYQINLILTQLLGDKSGILDLLGGIKGNYITLTTKISAGWGIILSLLAYIGAIISTYFIPGKKTVKIVKDEVIENKEIK